MGKVTRGRYSPDFKAKLALEAIRGEQTIAELSERRGQPQAAFGDRFEKEVREGCTTRSRGKPATIQELGRFLLAEPDHRGVAKLFARVAELKQGDADFSDIEMDHGRELGEAVRLANFDDLDTGFAEITHRRTYVQPKPPDTVLPRQQTYPKIFAKSFKNCAPEEIRTPDP